MIKILTKGMLVFTVIALLLLTYSLEVQAKKRCKPLLKKLHNIQMMQRQGYALKRGQSLRAKEDKARAKWWQCENTSLAKYKKQQRGVKKKSKNKVKKNKTSKYAARLTKNKKTAITTFNQHSAIVIKSKYQGSKRSAWLQFYQQPMKCRRPKTLNVFAYCSEDKLQQQYQFEQQYSK